MSIESSTKRGPARVRIVFTDGARTRATKIGWFVRGWDVQNPKDDSPWSAGGGGNFSLPKTVTYVVPDEIDFVAMFSYAEHNDPGTLRMVQQATY